MGKCLGCGGYTAFGDTCSEGCDKDVREREDRRMSKDPLPEPKGFVHAKDRKSTTWMSFIKTDGATFERIHAWIEARIRFIEDMYRRENFQRRTSEAGDYVLTVSRSGWMTIALEPTAGDAVANAARDAVRRFLHPEYAVRVDRRFADDEDRELDVIRRGEGSLSKVDAAMARHGVRFDWRTGEIAA